MQEKSEKVDLDQFFAAFADTSFDKQKLKKTLLIPPKPSRELDLRTLHQKRWVSDRGPDSAASDQASSGRSAPPFEPLPSPWCSDPEPASDVEQALNPDFRDSLDDFDEDFEAAAPEAFVPAQPQRLVIPPRPPKSDLPARPQPASNLPVSPPVGRPAPPPSAQPAVHATSPRQSPPRPAQPLGRLPKRPLIPPQLRQSLTGPKPLYQSRLLKAVAIFLGVMTVLELSDRYVKQCSATETCPSGSQLLNPIQAQLGAAAEAIQNRFDPGHQAFSQGVNLAALAGESAHTARTPEEWRLTIVYWRRAIAALQTVPTNSRFYPKAQAKIQAYQENLTYAKAAIDTFREGVNAATLAAELTQQAKTVQDWRQVGQLWLEALSLMRLVSQNSPHYAIAQQRLTQYADNFTYAQKQAMAPIQPAASQAEAQPELADIAGP